MKQSKRLTKETKIRASLELYGSGSAKVQTGVGFFDHMLEALSKHALWDLELVCEGDLQVDFHHSVEDVGIVLGGLLHDSLYPVQGIERYGNAAVVMDEACVECDLDISNRPFLVCELEVAGMVGDFDAELVRSFSARSPLMRESACTPFKNAGKIATTSSKRRLRRWLWHCDVRAAKMSAWECPALRACCD